MARNSCSDGSGAGYVGPGMAMAEASPHSHQQEGDSLAGLSLSPGTRPPPPWWSGGHNRGPSQCPGRSRRVQDVRWPKASPGGAQVTAGTGSRCQGTPRGGGGKGWAWAFRPPLRKSGPVVGLGWTAGHWPVWGPGGRGWQVSLRSVGLAGVSTGGSHGAGMFAARGSQGEAAPCCSGRCET